MWVSVGHQLGYASAGFAPVGSTSCRVSGVLHLFCHRAPGGRTQGVDYADPTPVVGWVLGCREATGCRSGVGKHSLRCRTTGASLGIPRPATRLRLSGSQAPGHPSATGNHGRAEKRVAAHRLWGGGRGDAPTGPTGRVFGLTAQDLVLGAAVNWERRESTGQSPSGHLITPHLSGTSFSQELPARTPQKPANKAMAHSTSMPPKSPG